MLADLPEVVIGVDTHADTHTAALVAVESRAVLDTITVAADPDGYAQLLALAESRGETRGGLRGWAIEGTGGYGAGLARHLAEHGETVIELDRLAGEPLDVLVNGTLIAHGEVVVVNEKFGIRLTDVISPSERIKKLR